MAQEESLYLQCTGRPSYLNLAAHTRPSIPHASSTEQSPQPEPASSSGDLFGSSCEGSPVPGSPGGHPIPESPRAAPPSGSPSVSVGKLTRQIRPSEADLEVPVSGDAVPTDTADTTDANSGALELPRLREAQGAEELVPAEPDIASGTSTDPDFETILARMERCERAERALRCSRERGRDRVERFARERGERCARDRQPSSIDCQGTDPPAQATDVDSPGGDASPAATTVHPTGAATIVHPPKAVHSPVAATDMHSLGVPSTVPRSPKSGSPVTFDAGRLDGPEGPVGRSSLVGPRGPATSSLASDVLEPGALARANQERKERSEELLPGSSRGAGASVQADGRDGGLDAQQSNRLEQRGVVGGRGRGSQKSLEEGGGVEGIDGTEVGLERLVGARGGHGIAGPDKGRLVGPGNPGTQIGLAGLSGARGLSGGRGRSSEDGRGGGGGGEGVGGSKGRAAGQKGRRGSAIGQEGEKERGSEGAAGRGGMRGSATGHEGEHERGGEGAAAGQEEGKGRPDVSKAVLQYVRGILDPMYAAKVGRICCSCTSVSTCYILLHQALRRMCS